MLQNDCKKIMNMKNSKKLKLKKEKIKFIQNSKNKHLITNLIIMNKLFNCNIIKQSFNKKTCLLKAQMKEKNVKKKSQKKQKMTVLIN